MTQFTVKGFVLEQSPNFCLRTATVLYQVFIFLENSEITKAALLYGVPDLWNRGHLKALNDNNLILNEDELPS